MALVLARHIQPRRVRESTLSAQEVVIRRYLVPHLGRVRFRELTPEHVESLLVRLQGPAFSSTSVLKVHRCLPRSLVVAMQRGLVSRNVCTLIDAPTPVATEVEPLTREEARRLLVAAGQRRDSACWILALATGLRQVLVRRADEHGAEFDGWGAEAPGNADKSR